MPHLLINGIVATRNKQPYIQIGTENGMICQLSMAEARNVANDILSLCARTECDAMIFKFFNKMEFPEAAAGALMQDFRDFRAELDTEFVQKSMDNPPDDWLKGKDPNEHQN